MFIGGLIGLIQGASRASRAEQYDMAEERRRKQEEADKAKAERDAREAAMKAKIDGLMKLHLETGQLYRNLTEAVPIIEKHLALAEKEFNDGVFAPFWDAIENTIWHMSEYGNLANRLRDSVRKYRAGVESIQQPMPKIDDAIGSIPDASPLAEKRLREIIRRAQGNFHFASIYEQRKTNSILAKGFANLKEAIEFIGASISSSVDSLSNELGREMRLIAEGQQAQSELLVELNDENTRLASEMQSGITERLDEQTKLLGKIQRGES